MKQSRFSTNISICLQNDTRYDHSYNEVLNDSTIFNDTDHRNARYRWNFAMSLKINQCHA